LGHLTLRGGLIDYKRGTLGNLTYETYCPGDSRQDEFCVPSFPVGVATKAGVHITTGMRNYSQPCPYHYRDEKLFAALYTASLATYLPLRGGLIDYKRGTLGNLTYKITCPGDSRQDEFCVPSFPVGVATKAGVDGGRASSQNDANTAWTMQQRTASHRVPWRKRMEYVWNAGVLGVCIWLF